MVALLSFFKKKKIVKRKKKEESPVQKTQKTMTVISAKSGCSKCYGRGWTGTDTKTGKKVLCRCATVRRAKKEVWEKAVQALLDEGMKAEDINGRDIIRKMDEDE